MTETTGHEHSSLNTLQEEMDCKTVDKENVDVEEAENDENSSTASIAYDEDEDICNIQTEAITAAAQAMVGAAVSNEELNKSIPDIAHTLNSTLDTDCGEGFSGGTGHRASLAKYRPAASSILARMCEDASQFLGRARELQSTVNTSTSRLNGHMEVFQKKATEFGHGGKEYYDALSTQYATLLEDVADKMRNMETAVNTYVSCATDAARVKVQDINKTTVLKDFAEAICNFLEKECRACSDLEWMWIKVKKDLEFEEMRKLSAKKKRKEAKYYCGFFTFVCGLITAISIILIKVESDKFYIMLGIGSLGVVGSILWWLPELYKCLKKRCNRTNEDQWLKISFAEDIIRECKQRMETAEAEHKEYHALNLGKADEKKYRCAFFHH